MTNDTPNLADPALWLSASAAVRLAGYRSHGLRKAARWARLGLVRTKRTPGSRVLFYRPDVEHLVAAAVTTAAELAPA